MYVLVIITIIITFNTIIFYAQTNMFEHDQTLYGYKLVYTAYNIESTEKSCCFGDVYSLISVAHNDFPLSLFPRT